MNAPQAKMGALAAIAVGIGVVGACSQPEPTCEVRVATAALSNGAARSEYLRLEPEQENAVVQVLAAGVPLCSGVLVAERIVLTAKHCTAHSGAQTFEVAFGAGAGASAGAFTSGARVLAEHEAADVAALELEQLPGSAAQVRPLPVAERLPTGLARGSLVQLSGFGFDALTLGRRGFLVERVTELAADHLLVSAGGLAGACFGDSGGPLLVRGDDGRAQTLALLDEGSGDCRGRDRYVRLDALADWLAREAGVTPPDPGEPTPPAPALGEEGRCFGALAAWYARSELHGEVCAGGSRCGWDRAAGGQRCIRPEADACDGIDDVGACREGAAVRCVRGASTRNPCSTCGFACARSPKSGLPVCLDLRGRDGG